MKNLFDNNNPLPDRNTNFRTVHVDRGFTENNGISPSDSTSLAAAGTAPYAFSPASITRTDDSSTASPHGLEDERVRRENQNAFFGIPRKRDILSGNAASPTDSPDLYGNTMQEIQDRADPAKLKWNWSGKTDEAFRYRSDEPARNAALKAFQRMGQLSPAETAAAEQSQKTINTANQEKNRNHAGDSLSFRAAGADAQQRQTGNAPIIRKEQMIHDLRNQADSADNARHGATGISRYQDNYQAAYLNTQPDDVTRQAADIYETPASSIGNQFATNMYGGVFDVPPVQWADLIPHSINRISRASGNGNLVETFSGLQEKVYRSGKDAMNGDSALTAPDGTSTATGKAVEIGNAVARLIPAVAFATLTGQYGINPRLIGSAFIAGEISDAYHTTEANALERYDRMSFDSLMQDPHFRRHYLQYRQYKPELVALGEAKKEAASVRGADEAAEKFLIHLATLRLDKLVPEEGTSAALDFARNMAKDGLKTALGEALRMYLKNGPAINDGHGW
ncbi:hypothetical protein NB640_11580 [Oxalobacter vibrioformis]|uniref:Uncharacterized protein n=1 Tax=Oxalobacter vibrioformis TaxID=933080 RepID=A0A9E9LVZ5_9BURK|nr:hypothetical protein [Oxalobacter vibrioformis]WAW09844.1 hypothetical protein NB640_11580 [Oxalobacter vibrioformis]